MCTEPSVPRVLEVMTLGLVRHIVTWPHGHLDHLSHLTYTWPAGLTTGSLPNCPVVALAKRSAC